MIARLGASFVVSSVIAQLRATSQPPDDHLGSRTDLAPRVAPVSEYERLVELAAKGLAERDNHPMPRSVTTPGEFYEVMAGAALDAIGLRELLDEVEASREQRELTVPADATVPVNADAAPLLGEELPDDPGSSLNAPVTTRDVWEDPVCDAGGELDGEPRKVESPRLRRKWVRTAEEHLAVVSAAVADLRKVFDVDGVVQSRQRPRTLRRR